MKVRSRDGSIRKKLKDIILGDKYSVVLSYQYQWVQSPSLLTLLTEEKSPVRVVVDHGVVADKVDTAKRLAVTPDENNMIVG